MRQALARTLSILGHPLLLCPAVTLAAMARQGGEPRLLGVSAAVFAATAAGILGVSWWKVRSGAWGHVDAIEPSERRSYNGIALALLIASAGVAWVSGAALVAAGLLAASLIVLAAMALAPRLKLSQHVAFACMAAVAAWWIAPFASMLTLLVVAALGWSRVELGRHTSADVLAGGGVGLAVGLLVRLIVERMTP